MNIKLEQEKQIVAMLKDFIDSLPDYRYKGTKDGSFLMDLVEKAGYNVEAHQEGIRGTSILFVKKYDHP